MTDLEADQMVSVVTITCRACGRVLSQSIPRYADLGHTDPDDDEIETERPCNYPFAQSGPCPDHPRGATDGGLPLLWTVRLLQVVPGRDNRPDMGGR
jgi:hypothetical protein